MDLCDCRVRFYRRDSQREVSFLASHPRRSIAAEGLLVDDKLVTLDAAAFRPHE